MLRLIRRLLLGILACAVLVLCGTYAFRALTKHAALCDGCNVILISLDAMSAESLSDGLPKLAERAEKEGVLFTHAYAPVKRQFSGHAALLTGAYPWDIGVLDETRSHMPQDIPLLPEVLASYGYSTAGFVQGALIDVPWGFSRGFSEWHHPSPRNTQSLEEYFSETEQWIETRTLTDTPYFLYLNPYDIYSFFDAEGTQNGFTYTKLRDASTSDAVALTEARDAYARKLLKLDSYLDALISTTKATGGSRKTVIVLTASYGEYLTHAPQEEVGSMHIPKSRSLNVPLLFFVPGVTAKRVLPTVESRNTAASILEVVGLNPEAVSGVSLASYLRSGSGKNQIVRSYVAGTVDEKLIEPPSTFYTYVERAYATSRQLQTPVSAEPADTRGFMLSLIYDVWHLVQDSTGTSYLFNTVRDPDEKTNLIERTYTLTPNEQQSIGVLKGAGIQKQ